MPKQVKERLAGVDVTALGIANPDAVINDITQNPIRRFEVFKLPEHLMKMLI
jgi:aspartate carbamoyltransferase regulatory subunit